MDLTKILSIAGKPGLHQMVAQTKNGLVVESLTDGKRFTAFAHERISSLEEISIYTYDEDLPLKDVLQRIYNHLEGKPAPSAKDKNVDLKAFFEEVIEDYDQDRVYVSDIKKMLNWYNQLLSHDMLDFSEEEEVEGKSDESAEESPGEVADEGTDDQKEEKPSE